jgi:hypothetical protein
MPAEYPPDSPPASHAMRQSFCAMTRLRVQTNLAQTKPARYWGSMGILRLILITLVGIVAAMLYFGRDDGLPETLIGRTPPPPAEVITPNAALDPVTEPEPEPDPAPPPPTAEVAERPAPTPPPAAPEIVVAPEPTPAPTPTPTPAPVVEPEPEPQPAPVVVEETPPAPAQPEPEPADTVLYVTGTKVNVRTGPATVYEVITSLERGAAVVDLGDAGEGWRLIRLGEGEIGYMSGDFLSPTAP